MKRRMQRNLVVLFLGCAALPLGAVAAIGYLSSARSVQSMIRNRLAFSCAEIDQKFNREMERLQEHLALIAHGGGVLPREWPSRARRVGSEIEFYTADLQMPGLEDVYTGFVFVDASGAPRSRIDYRSTPGHEKLRAGYSLRATGSREELGFALPGRLAPGEVRPVLPRADAGTMVIRLVSMLAAGGEHLGFLVGELDASRILESIVGRMSLGKDAYHFLLDSRTGVVLSHPDYSKRNQSMRVVMPGVDARALEHRPEGWLRYRDDDGEQWLLAHRRVSGTPWTVAVASPLGLFLAPIHRVGWISLVLVLAVLCVASTVIFFGTRRFRHSLASLTDASESFSAGDLDRRVEVTSDDEMAALAGAFNRMARQLRQQIDRREEDARLESFNRLSAAVAHDLKGTVFSLSLLVDNMERHGGDPEFLGDSAETLRSTVERMKRISVRLSERSPGAELKLRSFELADLFRDVLRESGVDGHPSVSVEVELPNRLRVLGDRAELERVFVNLLHNALEAMPGGGTLRLSARRVMEDEGARVRVDVRDTGVGMSREFVEQRLFRPFSSTKSGGVGLGLYSCKRIVDDHGGRIDVESEPGRGTRFSIVLPAAVPETR